MITGCMTPEEKVQIVTEILGPTKIFSITKIRFALQEAKWHILNYTNRVILPIPLEWMQCRMAADILLYLTPDTDDSGTGGHADPLKDLQRVKLDDAEFEAQDRNDTYVLSLAKQNPNMDFLKDYAAQLQMWRVVPRYRRPPFEPRPLVEEPIGVYGDPDAERRR